MTDGPGFGRYTHGEAQALIRALAWHLEDTIRSWHATLGAPEHAFADSSGRGRVFLMPPADPAREGYACFTLALPGRPAGTPQVCWAASLELCGSGFGFAAAKLAMDLRDGVLVDGGDGTVWLGGNGRYI